MSHRTEAEPTGSHRNGKTPSSCHAPITSSFGRLPPRVPTVDTDKANDELHHWRAGQRVSNFHAVLEVSSGDAPAQAMLRGEALYRQCLQSRLLESRRQRCHQHSERIPLGCCLRQAQDERLLPGLEQEQARGVQDGAVRRVIPEAFANLPLPWLG